MCHAPWGVQAGCSSSPFLRPWARRWINHWSLWRMATATPDLRLPSQPQGITACWPVPNYTAWWQKHACANNLPKVVAWKREAGSRSSALRSSESNALNNYATGAWKLCILKSTLFSDKQWTKAAKISDICLTERHGGHSALTDVQKIV